MKAVLILALCLSIGVVTIGASDVDSGIPTSAPRRGKALKPAVVTRYSKRHFIDGRQRVVIVPKGDPRARNPNPQAPTPVAPLPPVEQRIIVEAEDASAAATPAAPRRILQAAAPANPGACLKNYNGAAVAARAKLYQTTYVAQRTAYVYSGRQYGITAKKADCSSFVTSILNDMGYLCLFAKVRDTAYMNQQIRARGGYKQTAVLGDIVMWGHHTGLVVHICGAGSYKMAAMGTSGARLTPCLTVNQLKVWGSGGWLGFWTPHP
jgi:hypothetical protein